MRLRQKLKRTGRKHWEEGTRESKEEGSREFQEGGRRLHCAAERLSTMRNEQLFNFAGRQSLVILPPATVVELWGLVQEQKGVT